jgi:hypothetical protein
MTLITRPGFLWNETVWNPSMIQTALWLDASDATTINQSSNLVSQWNDKSSNGRNATASSSARPTYSATSFNSKPGMTFDGTANVLRADGLASIAQGSDTPFHAFVVGNIPNNTTFRVLWAFGNTASTDYFHQFRLTDTNALNTARRGVFPDDASLTGSSGSGANKLFGLAFTGTTAVLYQNGSQDATGAMNTGTLGANVNNFSIGAVTRNTVSGYLPGTISEIVFLAGTTSTDTRQKIEGYLAHKWGLEANLPVGHPYKTTGPTP